MKEYTFDKQGRELLESFHDTFDELGAVTEQLAQYVAFYYDRDRYAFLDKVAHCCDYYTSTDEISKCFDNMSESLKDMYFRV